MGRWSNLGRRQVLKILGALFGSALVAPRLHAISAIGTPTSVAASQLTALLKHRESALLIGGRFLEKRPNEADRVLLVSLISRAATEPAPFALRQTDPAKTGCRRKLLKVAVAHNLR